MQDNKPQRNRPQRRIAVAAGAATSDTIRAGAVRYDREIHLPRLIRALPAEIRREDPDATREIVNRLTRALSAERRRGRCADWTYDMNRHIALMQALAAETARLAYQDTGAGSS